MPINLPAPGFRDTANEYQFGGDCRRFDCCRLSNLHITVKSLLDLRLSALSFHDSSVPGLEATSAGMGLPYSAKDTCTRSSVYDQLNHQKTRQAKAIKLRRIQINIVIITILNNGDNAHQTGHTALQRAAAGGHLDIARLLVTQGASLDHQDELVTYDDDGDFIQLAMRFWEFLVFCLHHYKRAVWC